MIAALEAVSAYVPATSVGVEEIGARLGLSEVQRRVFRRFFGLDRVRRDPGASPADLMLSAAAKLEALRGREDQVRYVIQARTLQAVAPYSVNHVDEVRRALGLRRATAFAVTQHACASGLLALDLAGRLLAAEGDPDVLALVFTGEKAFTPIVEMIPNTTFMGEGAAACLVRSSGERDRVLAYATRTLGRYNEGLAMTPELAAEFQREYVETLAEVMLTAVQDAGLALGDLALVLPQNVNRISWVRLCKLLGYPLERVFLDNVPVTGHCFCADSFINYRDACDLGRLAPGDRYVMTAVGLGSMFSATVLEH